MNRRIFPQLNSFFILHINSLSYAWGRFVTGLNRRVNAQPMPRHHRLGAWERSVFTESTKHNTTVRIKQGGI